MVFGNLTLNCNKGPQYYQSIQFKVEPMNFLNLLSGASSLFNFNFASNFKASNPSPNLQVVNTRPLNHIIKQPQCGLLPIQTQSRLSQPQNVPELNKDSTVELLTQQQQLINQYMHLNLQLLSKKLQTLEQNDKMPKGEQLRINSQAKSSKKKIKKENNCGHPQKQHYAKGMCNNCYHKFGRLKKPWNCSHNKLYANGMCQNCYINSYNKKKRQERVQGNNEMELASELKQEQQ